MNKHVIKTYLKLVTPRINGLVAQQDCDRQVDAGEWSGKYFDDALDLEQRKVAMYVLRKFKMLVNPMVLINAAEIYEAKEFNCFMNHLEVTYDCNG